MYESILSRLLVDKNYLLTIFLIDFNLYIIFYKAKLIYCFIIDDRDIKMINKA